MLYLHAGFYKTGTTSIQTTLFFNREKLRSLGVGYFGHSANHSVPLLCAFSSRGRGHSEIMRKRLSSDEVEQLGRETREGLDAFLADPACSTKIISGEGLSDFSSDEIVRLKTCVGRLCPEPRVIFYVRNYFDYLNSQIQEQVRWGASLPALSTRIRKGALNSRVAPSIARFAEHFGAENIQVRLFHRDRLAGGDLLNDFCAAVGRPDVFGHLEQRRLNESMSEASTHLMSDYNMLFPAVVDGAYNWRRAYRAAGHFAKDDGPKYRFLDEDVLAVFAERAARDADGLEPFLDASARALLMQRGTADGVSAQAARSKATYERAIRKLGETLVELEGTEAVLEIALGLLKDGDSVSAKTHALAQTSLSKLRSDALCHRLARALLAAGRPGLAEIAAKRALELDRTSERHMKLAAGIAKALGRRDGPQA